MQNYTDMGEWKMINSKCRKVKRLTALAAAAITAAMMLGGCGDVGNVNSEENTVPANYAPESITPEPLKISRVVKTVAKYNSGNIKFKEAYIGTLMGYVPGGYYDDSGSSGFVVNYSFVNNSGMSAYMEELAGELNAYQNGIQLPSQIYGNYNEWTEILSGHSLDLTTVFITDNYEDPVELIAESYWGETYHAVMTPKLEVKMLPTGYRVDIKGAGFTDSGKIVVDSTFTNTENYAIAPAKIYDVQAFQGTKQLYVSSESTDDKGYLLKWFQIEPNETADISTTFLLDNSDEDVTVYLTDPATGRPFVKKNYKQ